MEQLSNTVITKIDGNKSSNYLLPCLFMYEYFTLQLLKDMTGVRLYLGIKGYTPKEENTIALVFKMSQSKKHMLLAMRNLPYYVDDFSLGHINSFYSNKHAVILKLKDRCHAVVEKFKKGKYSEMFTRNEIEELYDTPLKQSQMSYHVFKRSKYAEEEMIKALNKKFNVSYKSWNGEYDFPPKLSEEYFEIQ
jgi:predicted DNA-binding protein YlxM (UPF0122 family)